MYQNLFNKYFYIIVFLSYIFLLVIYRFLLPFGDEPDFHIRASSVVRGYQEWWTPIDFIRLNFFYDLFAKNLNYLSQCNIDYNPLSILSKIDNSLCSDTISNNIKRVIISLTHISFFFIIIYFLNKLYFLKLNKDRFKTLILCLLLPSIIYYFNLLSHESFFYIISFFIFIFIKKRLILLILILFLLNIDFGNSIAILIFIFLYYTNILLNKFLSLKLSALIIIIVLIFSILFSEIILNFISQNNLIPNQQVNQFIDSTIRHNYDSSFRHKYPLVLRPIITYMNFIFLTPGFIKILPLYVFISVILLYIFYKTILLIKIDKNIKNYYHPELRDSIQFVFISLFTILFLTLNLPALTNAKYFIFLIPFFIQHIRIIVKNDFLLFINLLFANFLVTSNLLIYRLL